MLKIKVKYSALYTLIWLLLSAQLSAQTIKNQQEQAVAPKITHDHSKCVHDTALKAQNYGFPHECGTHELMERMLNEKRSAPKPANYFFGHNVHLKSAPQKKKDLSSLRKNAENGFCVVDDHFDDDRTWENKYGQGAGFIHKWGRTARYDYAGDVYSDGTQIREFDSKMRLWAGPGTWAGDKLMMHSRECFNSTEDTPLNIKFTFSSIGRDVYRNGLHTQGCGVMNGFDTQTLRELPYREPNAHGLHIVISSNELNVNHGYLFYKHPNDGFLTSVAEWSWNGFNANSQSGLPLEVNIEVHGENYNVWFNHGVNMISGSLSGWLSGLNLYEASAYVAQQGGVNDSGVNEFYMDVDRIQMSGQRRLLNHEDYSVLPIYFLPTDANHRNKQAEVKQLFDWIQEHWASMGQDVNIAPVVTVNGDHSVSKYYEFESNGQGYLFRQEADQKLISQGLYDPRRQLPVYCTIGFPTISWGSDDASVNAGEAIDFYIETGYPEILAHEVGHSFGHHHENLHTTIRNPSYYGNVDGGGLPASIGPFMHGYYQDWQFASMAQVPRSKLIRGLQNDGKFPVPDVAPPFGHIIESKVTPLKVRANGMYLEVENQSTSNGARIVQQNGSGSNNQKWLIEHMGEKTHRIINQQTGKVLEANPENYGNRANGGAAVQQGTWDGADNQLWYFEPFDRTRHKGMRIRSRLNTPHCMDMEMDNSNSPGAPAKLFPLWKSQHVIFELEDRYDEAIAHMSGATATQSSSAYGAASNAIDGNLSNFSHTNENEYRPWLEIDLGQVKDISQLELFNREDCCQERLQSFHVFVSDAPFTSSDPNQVKNQPGVMSFYHEGVLGPFDYSPIFEVNRSARYIRVQLENSGTLSLAEVLAYPGNNANAPTVDFTANKTQVEGGESVSFTDNSSNNPTSWSWSFEGGTPSISTEQNPTVTYNIKGDFNVSLRVTNADGSDTETKFNYITVASEEICTGSDVHYTLMNVNSRKVLDVNGVSTINGANVQQWTSNNGNNQKWYFEDVGNGQYSLTNVNSGKVLEVEGNSTSNGGNVQQWDYTNSNSQKWTIQSQGDGKYSLLNVNSGKALEIGGFSTDNGGNAQQWDYVGANSQQWIIERISDNSCQPTCIGSCDDGDPCTVGETYDASCNCVGGALLDNDNDGVCDTQDQCPGFNDNIDSDGDGIPDGCDNCSNSTIGTACDDGNPCTVGETYNASCNCVGGTLLDSDDDGVCDSQDICPGFNDNIDSDGDGIPDGCDDCSSNVIGTACDDGDPCTVGETYDSNCRCGGGVITDSDNDGVCDSEDQCPGFDDNRDSDSDGIPDGCDDCSSNVIGTACDDGDPCTVGETYDSNCRCGGGVITDSDNDGVCDSEDQCPGFDDNRDSDSDGIPDGCDNCSSNVIGTACDDGDPCTVGETYDASCNCVGGTLLDSDNDGVCNTQDQCPGFNDNIDSDGDGIPDGCDNCSSNLIGVACNDGDPCTLGETYDASCNCTGGAYIDADNDGTCAANDVDDNNPCVPVPVLSSCIAGNCTEIYDINSFETGLGIWNDGGSDAYRLFNSQYAQTGNYSLRIRDNSGQGSSFYTDAMNWSNMSGAEVKFSFYANSMENGESFKLELSLNGGATYQEVKKWSAGSDFNNNNTYDELVAIENISFSQNVVLRFVCDASSNGDQVYIDDVEIMMCADDNGGASCTVGSPCNDGNDCTVGETYNNDCQCANGIYVDADNDGTCAANDVDDNNPCVPVPVLSSCGGSDCTEVYDASSFESGLGIWNDGGSDAYRLFNSQYAQTGSYSLRIRDNSGQSSSFYTDAMNWSNVSEAEVKFSFYANSMEFGESFKLELSLNGGASYQEVKSWISGTDFNNNNTYDELVAIENISFSQNVVLRFVCDASSNGDQVYIDDVEIMICNSNGVGGLSCIIGGPCDDGNECTVGETYNSDCLCANGTYVDADNDGYCISDDPNDEDPCIPVSGSGCQSDGCQEMMGNNFEIDLGMWIDGGSDAYRLYNPQYSKSGDYSLRIRDNSGASSSFYTYPLDLSSYSSVILHFSYYPNSMESGETFYLEISTDGGISFTIIEDWTSYVEFNNGNRYDEVLTISNGLLSNNVVLRFRSDASSNADQIYLDDIVLEGCGGSNLVAPQVRSRSYVNKMTLSPNPVSRLLKVVGLSSDEEIRYEIYSISGMRVGAGALENETIDVSTLVSGVYLLKVITDTDTSSEIFIKSE